MADMVSSGQEILCAEADDEAMAVRKDRKYTVKTQYHMANHENQEFKVYHLQIDQRNRQQLAQSTPPRPGSSEGWGGCEPRTEAAVQKPISGCTPPRFLLGTTATVE